MLEIMGFSPHERRLLPWFFTALVLAMVLGFALLDFVDRNPSRIHSLFVAEQTHDSLRSLPEAIRRLR